MITTKAELIDETYVKDLEKTLFNEGEGTLKERMKRLNDDFDNRMQAIHDQNVKDNINEAAKVILREKSLAIRREPKGELDNDHTWARIEEVDGKVIYLRGDLEFEGYWQRMKGEKEDIEYIVIRSTTRWVNTVVWRLNFTAKNPGTWRLGIGPWESRGHFDNLQDALNRAANEDIPMTEHQYFR